MFLNLMANFVFILIASALFVTPIVLTHIFSLGMSTACSLHLMFGSFGGMVLSNLDFDYGD